MEYITGMLLDAKKGTTEVVSIEKENDTSSCEKIYELLDCQHFGCRLTRKINQL